MNDESPALISTLDAAFQPYVIQFITALRNAGIPAMVISGRRSPERNRAVGGAVNSLHLSGLAFDVQIFGYARDDLPYWWWQAVGQYWESLGGRWGGLFDDVNHFDAGARPESVVISGLATRLIDDSPTISQTVEQGQYFGD